jgi:hypothetical protein
MQTEIIVALIGLFSGIAGALLLSFFQHRKTDAEADKLTADANETVRITVMGLLDPLNKKISDLECRVRALEGRSTRYLKRIVYLMDGIRCLIVQLEDARLSPVWKPDDWKPDEED